MNNAENILLDLEKLTDPDLRKNSYPDKYFMEAI